MPLTREDLRSISRAKVGVIDETLSDSMDRLRSRKGPFTWLHGGGETYTIHDEMEKEISLFPERGAPPIKIQRDEMVLPDALRVKGGPSRIFVGDAFVINPNAFNASHLLNPTPTLVSSSGDKLDGLLGAVSGILGAF